jgi:hypothetical protein
MRGRLKIMPNDRTDQSQIDRKAVLRDLIRASSRFLDHTKSQFRPQGMDKLSDDEMNQLKTLLVRYLAYHAQGVFNMAVDALLARFKPSAPMIDTTLVPELPSAGRQPKRKEVT